MVALCTVNSIFPCVFKKNVFMNDLHFSYERHEIVLFCMISEWWVSRLCTIPRFNIIISWRSLAKA